MFDKVDLENLRFEAPVWFSYLSPTLGFDLRLLGSSPASESVLTVESA